MIIGSSFEVRTMRLSETWRKSAFCPNFEIKTGIDGAELVLGVYTKVVGMDVSFLMPLVSRQNNI